MCCADTTIHGQNEKRRDGLKAARRKNAVRVNAIAVAQIIAALNTSAYTAYDLEEISGLSIQTVRHYLKALYKAKAIHIADWTEDGRGNRTTRAFMIGDFPDAKKPQPITAKEACAKYRAKMKQLKLVQQMTGQNNESRRYMAAS